MMSRHQRRFRRSRKGMSTIFGALFFVILILMGFNMFLWSFVQFDNYNRVLTNMTQMDTMSQSENLVPNNPGARDFGANSFNITVNNLGIDVRIARIYIINLSPTNSNQCLPANPCIVDAGPTIPGIVNGNVKRGVLDYRILVNTGGGLAPINDGSGYKVIMSTTRGRQFSFFYPWPVTPPSGGGNGGTFVTNVGPLNIYFDFKSFNFTKASQTQSQPAWCVPSNTPLVFWVKISNAATDSSVTLKKSTVIFPQPYSNSGSGGQFGPFYVVDSTTLNPSPLKAYNEATNPYVLPAATASGPSAFVTVKFGASTAGGTGTNTLFQDDFWIVLMGFNYIYQGQVQGQTIPFVAMKSAAGAPGTC